MFLPVACAIECRRIPARQRFFIVSPLPLLARGNRLFPFLLSLFFVRIEFGVFPAMR